MNEELKNLVGQVDKIKYKIQDGSYIDKNTYKELENEVDELRKMVVSLDKEVAVNSEKQSSIYIQLDRLDEKIKDLTNNTVVKDTRKKDTTEKVLLLVLGSIITFIFNKFS
ncbi:hemolysin [Staphylococcus phage phiRNIID]|nr:hemolysin [Staphylococcus phage phiRNIID]